SSCSRCCSLFSAFVRAAARCFFANLLIRSKPSIIFFPPSFVNVISWLSLITNYSIQPFFHLTTLVTLSLVLESDPHTLHWIVMRLFHALIQFSKPVPLHPLNPLTNNTYLLHPNQACHLRYHLENKEIVVLLWQDKYRIPESLPGYSLTSIRL